MPACGCSSRYSICCYSKDWLGLHRRPRHRFEFKALPFYQPHPVFLAGIADSMRPLFMYRAFGKDSCCLKYDVDESVHSAWNALNSLACDLLAQSLLKDSFKVHKSELARQSSSYSDFPFIAALISLARLFFFAVRQLHHNLSLLWHSVLAG